QNELKENLYGGLSKIAHSNYEKLSLPIGIAGNELKVICYQYIGKTQTEYNQKVAENLFRLNNTILIKAMHTYCDYLAKNQQIPLVEEVEKRGANKNVVKLIKKFNENFAKLSKHYEEVVK
ncbi:MAG: hypothetical protein NTY48_04360, partial [Candidatus Diapherotrites archaeon]|nr:hypothetical protein [Candidatus Diapherotrites archaeon]